MDNSPTPDLDPATLLQVLPEPDPDRIPDRRPRVDGWTAQVQQAFIMHLVEEGSVRAAAARVDRHVTSAYRLRRQSPAFARAWDTARRMAYAQLRDIAMERAIDGTPQEVWRDGQWVGMKRVRSDRLLMNLLTHLKASGDPRANCQPDDLEDARSDALARDLDALADAPPGEGGAGESSVNGVDLV